MKTRFLIIIGIVMASIVFGTYQSLMYNCGTMPVFMETPNKPTLWKCLDIWKHQSEQPSPQRILSDPICFVADRTTSGEKGSAVTMDACISLEAFEEMGCTKSILEHILKHSNLLDYEGSEPYYLEWVGLPSEVSQEKFDECFDAILEKRPLLDSRQIDEPKNVEENNISDQLKGVLGNCACQERVKSNPDTMVVCNQPGLVWENSTHYINNNICEWREK